MNVQLIAKDSVTKTYAGGSARVGWRGTYADSGSAVTRRLNEVNRAIEAGTPVAEYNFHDGDCFELVKPNGRVIRIYVSK